MKALIDRIENLKNTKVKRLIDTRLKEFKSNNGVFSELCFCILTANFNAEKTIRIQNDIGKYFSTLSESELTEKLTKLGHCYPKIRAKYIVEARKCKDLLKNINL